MNDLLLNIQGAKLILYADDTNDLITDRSPDTLQTKFSLVVKQLEIWFLNNDLIINSSKTVDMSFHLCNSIPNYKPYILLQNNCIEYKIVVKFLGLYTTGNLNWQTHICYLWNNLSKYVIVIKFVKKNISETGCSGTFVSHNFMRKLDMGLFFFLGAVSESKHKSINDKNNVIRLITGVKRLDSCR